MPVYDFECRGCGERFEVYASIEGEEDSGPVCPACGSPGVRRVFSAFAGPFTVGMRGAAARRSNAERRVREEKRKERREQRRGQV